MNKLYWWVYWLGVFNWISGLMIKNYYLAIFGISLIVGEFLGWFGELYNEK